MTTLSERSRRGQRAMLLGFIKIMREGFHDYQILAKKYVLPLPSRLIPEVYCALGLAGEVGEAVEKIKKIWRDSGGKLDDVQRKHLLLEFGDVLWYLSETARHMEIDMGEVAVENLRKLSSRMERAALRGSGDSR